MSKVSDDDIRAMRKRVARGEEVKSVASDLDWSESTVYHYTEDIRGEDASLWARIKAFLFGA